MENPQLITRSQHLNCRISSRKIESWRTTEPPVKIVYQESSLNMEKRNWLGVFTG